MDDKKPTDHVSEAAVRRDDRSAAVVAQYASLCRALRQHHGMGTQRLPEGLEAAALIAAAHMSLR